MHTLNGRDSYDPNSFHQTMRNLHFRNAKSFTPDLFSMACVEQFINRQMDSYGYLFAQVFESYVLAEIAELENVEITQLTNLEIGDSSAIQILRSAVANHDVISPMEAVNFAAALISISRFDLADLLLQSASRKPTMNRDQFEISMLHFVIENRRGNNDKMRHFLLEMRKQIEVGNLPLERQIDAASLAVVWHMKLGILKDTDFKWFSSLGTTLATTNKIESGALSSWYRAVAMIPAAKGDKVATRETMLAARRAADITMKIRPRAYEAHFLKTYHESSIKEHMFVTGDYQAAIREGESLLSLDPVWSISFGEVAEVHRHFGDFSTAATYFEEGACCGPPYVGHHIYSAATCHEAAGELNRALELYVRLLGMSPNNKAVIISGAKLARKIRHESFELFSRALDQIRPYLDNRHLMHLAD